MNRCQRVCVCVGCVKKTRRSVLLTRGRIPHKLMNNNKGTDAVRTTLSCNRAVDGAQALVGRMPCLWPRMDARHDARASISTRDVFAMLSHRRILVLKHTSRTPPFWWSSIQASFSRLRPIARRAVRTTHTAQTARGYVDLMDPKCAHAAHFTVATRQSPGHKEQTPAEPC